MDAGQVAVGAVGVRCRGRPGRRPRRVEHHQRDERRGQRRRRRPAPTPRRTARAGRRRRPWSRRRRPRRPAGPSAGCPSPGRAARPGTSRRRPGRWPRCCWPRRGRPARAPSASSTTEPDIAASDPRTAAPTRPASSTSRSPRRSVTIPHGTSASITPAIGAAATRPAWARVSPSRSCSTGIRNAGPCTITAVDAWATVLAASIAQRRRTPTSAARSTVAVTRRLKRPIRRSAGRAVLRP